MPGLQLVKTLGAAKFYSHGLQLPEKWQPRSSGDAGDHFGKVFKGQNRVAVPRLVPPWFRPAEQLDTFQTICDTIGQDFKDLHDRVCDGVVEAHNDWRKIAFFKGVNVLAPVATGPPGCLTSTGFDFATTIKGSSSCRQMIGYWAKYRDAAATGIAQCFGQWQNGVTVPGLPLFPQLALMPPGPAPPFQNVPFPLISFVSPAISQITSAPAMAQAMQNALSHQFNNAQVRALFDAIATTLSIAFMSWLPAQMVMKLTVTGSSTAAPPVTPTAPVVGIITPTPGCLNT